MREKIDNSYDLYEDDDFEEVRANKTNQDEVSNAGRFLSAYNKIDQTLRVVYDLKRSLNFSEVIRKTVQLNSIVRKFEDDLIDYGRLRNAIVHKGRANFVIAEPHPEVVEKLEHIANLIATPPLAYDKIATHEVLCIDSELSLSEAMQLMSRSGYSNLPVYRGKTLMGVLNGQKLVNILGFKLEDHVDLEDYVEKTKVKDIIAELENASYYAVEGEDLTLEHALTLFENNRKLLAILITKDGKGGYPPLGIITNSDVIDMQKVLDNY